MSTLQVYDTITRNKRPFEPLRAGEVSLYVCGLTVYDLPHIGHARTFVFFDVVRRYLEHRGYNVLLVRNHTDVDDKIIRRARELGEAPQDLAERMIEALGEDMDSLGILRAHIEPKVTEHIDDIIQMTATLIERGHAYAIDGDVFFRVTSFEEYGKLSRRNLDDQASGVRVDVDQRKEDPRDFALWKSAKPGDPSWGSPWGAGRPGWHIECSAMSHRFLGESFDIHGGGRDLIFPHHENEIAQSKAACGGEHARYWMHVGMLEINGEKMSHSLDNFWTVRDIVAQVHPEALRYFFLTAHYRNSVNFSRETIREATLRVAYLYRTLEALSEAIARRHDALNIPDGPMAKADVIADIEREFYAAMDDDFNTPCALAELGRAAKLANEFALGKKKPSNERVRAMLELRGLLTNLGASLGLLSGDYETVLSDLTTRAVAERQLDVNVIGGLVSARSTARAEKNWSEADRLRDQLLGMGIQVLDRPNGTLWRLEGI